MPAQSATPYWQPAFPSHPGTYNPNLQPSIERHHDAAGLFNQCAYDENEGAKTFVYWCRITVDLLATTKFHIFVTMPIDSLPPIGLVVIRAPELVDELLLRLMLVLPLDMAYNK
ncbi:hypothetical protein Tco_0268557 [Tanacetum coccineum]